LLPSTVRSIGSFGFGRCLSLATIAIPWFCQRNAATFGGCSPHVTEF
jgi:hypothetical protein